MSSISIVQPPEFYYRRKTSFDFFSRYTEDEKKFIKNLAEALEKELTDFLIVGKETYTNKVKAIFEMLSTEKAYKRTGQNFAIDDKGNMFVQCGKNKNVFCLNQKSLSRCRDSLCITLLPTVDGIFDLQGCSCFSRHLFGQERKGTYERVKQIISILRMHLIVEEMNENGEYVYFFSEDHSYWMVYPKYTVYEDGYYIQNQVNLDRDTNKVRFSSWLEFPKEENNKVEKKKPKKKVVFVGKLYKHPYIWWNTRGEMRSGFKDPVRAPNGYVNVTVLGDVYIRYLTQPAEVPVEVPVEQPVKQPSVDDLKDRLTCSQRQVRESQEHCLLLKEELEETQKTSQNLSGIIANMTKNDNDRECSINHLKAIIENLESQIEDWRIGNSIVQDTLQILNGELADEKEKTIALEKQLAEKEAEITALREQSVPIVYEAWNPNANCFVPSF